MSITFVELHQIQAKLLCRHESKTLLLAGFSISTHAAVHDRAICLHTPEVEMQRELDACIHARQHEQGISNSELASAVDALLKQAETIEFIDSLPT